MNRSLISKRRGAIRSLWTWLFIGLVLLVVAALLLPTMLGSRWIYAPFLDKLRAGDFQVDVSSVKLRWFAPLVLEDVVIHDRSRTPLLKIKSIETDRGLIRSLLGGRRIGKLTINEPTIQIELLTDGSNLSRLVDAIREGSERDLDKSSSSPLSIDIDVDIRNASVTVASTAELKQLPLVVVPPFDLAVHYRAVDTDARLRLDPTKILKEVKLTPELMKLGIDRAIPMLAKSAWVDGKISLAIGEIDVPLAAPELATGTATILLHEVRSGPSDQAILDILDLVAQLRGVNAHHELVFVSGAEVQLAAKESRIFHSGLELGLPKIDPRLQISSSGSVGIKDRSLDLILKVPVPLEQLARREQVRELGVPTIDLPIAGTLDAPEVRWQTMRGEGADLLGIIRQQIAPQAPGAAAALGTLEGIASGQADETISAAVDLVKQLRELRQARKKGSTPSEDGVTPPTDTTEPAPKENERPVLDFLRGVLRGPTQPPQK